MQISRVLKMIIAVNIVAIISIGLALGITVGLSASPVVASVVTALLTVVAALVGIQNGVNGPTFARGVFALALAISLLPGLAAGLYLRTHNLLAMDLSAAVKVWADAGYTEDVARAIVAYQRVGFAASGNGGDRSPSIIDSVLFNASTSGSCGVLDADRFMNPANRLTEMAQTEGAWAQLADLSRRIDDVRARAAAADAAWAVLCVR